MYGVRPFPVLPLLVLLAITPAAADTIITYTDINADLAAADQPCAAIDDVVQKTECFNARERVVWLKDSPESIAAYDLFSARRIQLINQVWTGAIGWGEYMRDFRAAQRRLFVYKTVTVPRRQ